MAVNEDTPDFVLENPYGNQGSNYEFEGENLPLEGEQTSDSGLSSSGSAHIDVSSGSAPGSGMLDYSSLFVSIANAGGAIATTVGKGLPGPVAASKAAEAEKAARQNSRIATPTPPGSSSPAATGPARANSTAATIAVGAGVLATAALVTLAATRKRRP